MINFVLEAVFFILPAYLANMAPVMVRKTGMPMGGVISKKWLGAHKTWVGLGVGVIVGILTIYLQRYLVGFEFFEKIAMIDYGTGKAVLFGALMGFGALIGDLWESFIKRRLKIAAGKPFVPWDQIDFLIGALVFTVGLYFPGWGRVGVLLIITPLLHFLTNLVGYGLGFKKVWW